MLALFVVQNKYYINVITFDGMMSISSFMKVH